MCTAALLATSCGTDDVVRVQIANDSPGPVTMGLCDDEGCRNGKSTDRASVPSGTYGNFNAAVSVPEWFMIVDSLGTRRCLRITMASAEKATVNGTAQTQPILASSSKSC